MPLFTALLLLASHMCNTALIVMKVKLTYWVEVTTMKSTWTCFFNNLFHLNRLWQMNSNVYSGKLHRRLRDRWDLVISRRTSCSALDWILNFYTIIRFNFYEEQIANQFTLMAWFPLSKTIHIFPLTPPASIIPSRHKSSVTLLRNPALLHTYGGAFQLELKRLRIASTGAERCDVPNKSNLANSSNWIPFRLQKCFPSWCSIARRKELQS